MLATIPSATLLGVDGHPVTVEVHVSQRPARLHRRRPARRRVPRGARPGAGRPRCRAGCAWPPQRVTVNLAPSGAAQGRRRARPRHRRRRCSSPTGELPPEAVAGLRLPRRARPRRLACGRCPASCRWSTPCRGDVGRRAGRLRRRGRARRPARGAAGGHAWPSWSPCLAGRGAVARPAGRPPRADPPARRPTWPTSAASRSARLALEVPPPAATTCCWSGRPARARRCWPAACPACCPPLDARRRARRPPGSTRRPGVPLPRRRARRAGRRSGRRTTAPRRCRSSAAAPASMRPGEISLAHGGVLFLDELGEFPPHGARRPAPAARGGRRPGRRAQASVTFPARFLLVGGHEPVPVRRGRPPGRVPVHATRPAPRYRRRLSGPLLDRFDLRVDVARPDVADLLGGPRRASRSAAVAAPGGRGPEPGAGAGASRCNAELPAAPARRRRAARPGGARDLLEHALRAGPAQRAAACTGSAGWPAPSPTSPARDGPARRRARRAWPCSCGPSRSPPTAAAA